MAQRVKRGPDSKGRFGPYGGQYVPETVMYALAELERSYRKLKKDKSFLAELSGYLSDFVGRPSSLYFSERFTAYLKGPKVYFKREDLNHTGAHKINNTVGQILLAKHVGKKRLISETGAGKHGPATATGCARFGSECIL